MHGTSLMQGHRKPRLGSPVRNYSAMCIRTLCFVLVVAVLGLGCGAGLRALSQTTPLYFATNFPEDVPKSAPAENCVEKLNLGTWTRWIVWPEACQRLPETLVPGCDSQSKRHWQFDRLALQCGAKRSNASEVQEDLRGGIALAGDSIMRYIFVALLRAAGMEVPIFQRHADSQVVLPGGTSVKFLWRPYPSEILDQVKRWANGSDTAPNVAVTSSCLWHMLWTNNATEFASEMELLEQPVQQLLRKKSTHLIVSTCTAVFPSLMWNPHKVARLTPAVRRSYDDALREVGALRSLPRLDLAALTSSCGIGCSIDGVHYNDALNDVAAQILLAISRSLRGS